MWEQRGGSAQRAASPSPWSELLWLKHTHLLLCTRSDTSHTHTSCHYPSTTRKKTVEVIIFYPNILSYWDCIYLLPFFHDSESVRKSTYTDGGVGGGGVWLVTTPLSSKWARATGWWCMCVCVFVCVSTELPLCLPLPFTAVLFFTDLVATATSCVDVCTFVQITTKRWLKRGRSIYQYICL